MTEGIRRTVMGHWVVTDDTVLAKYVEDFGTFEFPDNVRDLRAIAPYVPEDGVVVDAGACIGDHTCSYARMVGPSGRVYAFEPHPASFAALIRNTRPFNVVAINYALGETARSSTLVASSNVGASYLGPSAQSVEMRALDGLLGWLDRLDVIHLDAEGYEPHILKGAEQLIARFRPVLMVEVTDGYLRRYGSSETALLAQIAGYGYRVERVPGSTQYDVIAIPAECVVVEPVPELRHVSVKG